MLNLLFFGRFEISLSIMDMPFPVSLSSQQCRLYDQSFKIHFMLSVLNLGLHFIEEIEPSKLFGRKFR